MNVAYLREGGSIINLSSWEQTLFRPYPAPFPMEEYMTSATSFLRPFAYPRTLAHKHLEFLPLLRLTVRAILSVVYLQRVQPRHLAARAHASHSSGDGPSASRRKKRRRLFEQRKASRRQLRPDEQTLLSAKTQREASLAEVKFTNVWKKLATGKESGGIADQARQVSSQVSADGEISASTCQHASLLRFVENLFPNRGLCGALPIRDDVGFSPEIQVFRDFCAVDRNACYNTLLPVINLERGGEMIGSGERQTGEKGSCIDAWPTDLAWQKKNTCKFSADSLAFISQLKKKWGINNTELYNPEVEYVPHHKAGR